MLVHFVKNPGEKKEQIEKAKITCGCVDVDDKIILGCHRMEN